MFGMISMHFIDKIKKKYVDASGKKSLPCKEKTENQSVCNLALPKILRVPCIIF